jgi:hypothetical protein
MVQSFAGNRGAKKSRETSAKTAAISAHSYTVLKKGMRTDKKNKAMEKYMKEKKLLLSESLEGMRNDTASPM